MLYIKPLEESFLTNRSSRPEGLMLLSNIFVKPEFSKVAWFFGRPLPAA